MRAWIAEEPCMVPCVRSSWFEMSDCPFLIKVAEPPTEEFKVAPVGTAIRWAGEKGEG